MDFPKWAASGLFVSTAFLFGWATAAENQAAAPPDGREAVFEMRELPVLGDAKLGDDALEGIARQGVQTGCDSQRPNEVKAWPKLQSPQPMYGHVVLDPNPADPHSGKKRFFVLDEVDEGKIPQQRTSVLRAMFDSVFGSSSEQPRFNRLYFDLNGDGDLTNDPVLKPAKAVPKGLQESVGVAESAIAFEEIRFPVDYGPGTAPGMFRLLPVVSAEGGTFMVTFVPASAREGKIRIGKREFRAILTQGDAITGRFDRPAVVVYLLPLGATEEQGDVQRQTLSSMFQVDGGLYQFASTPQGDKLSVRPYRGAYGVVEIRGKGKEPGIQTIEGEFMSSSGWTLSGLPATASDHGPTGQLKLPVGDYRALELNMQRGTVGILARAFDADDFEDGRKVEATFPIKVRKDGPYVLDFSTKPEVVLLNPAPGQGVKPGETVRLRAVLTDPALGLLIRDVEDRSQRGGPRGDPSDQPTYPSLHPRLTITDSKGKTVAEGDMRFG